MGMDRRTTDARRDVRRETRAARVPFQPLPSQGTSPIHPSIQHLLLNSPFPLRVPDSRTRTHMPAFCFFGHKPTHNLFNQRIHTSRPRPGASAPHKLTQLHTQQQSHYGTCSKIIYDPCRPLVPSIVSFSSEDTLFELVGRWDIPPSPHHSAVTPCHLASHPSIHCNMSDLSRFPAIPLQHNTEHRFHV